MGVLTVVSKFVDAGTGADFVVSASAVSSLVTSGCASSRLFISASGSDAVSCFGVA